LRAAATAERPAKVINIASIDGIFVNPMETYSYAASKAAVIHLTRRMATKLIKENINVTAIAPGAFKSDMNRAARDHADEEVAKRVPARRVGTDEDMAGIAIYLASRAGDYVVGNTIAVDGGVVYASAGKRDRGGKSQPSYPANAGYQVRRGLNWLTAAFLQLMLVSTGSPASRVMTACIEGAIYASAHVSIFTYSKSPGLLSMPTFGGEIPVGVDACVGHRLHQRGDEVTVLCRRQPIDLALVPGGVIDQHALGRGVDILEFADLAVERDVRQRQPEA